MTPEAQRSLEKADNCLLTSRAELAINLGSEAGRNAYLAAFHSARAFIFECAGKVVRRHESAHREFRRLAKDEPAIEKSFPPFLSQGYNMKAIADNDTAPGSFVSSEEAAVAIETASRFVDCIRRVLTPGGVPTP